MNFNQSIAPWMAPDFLLPPQAAHIKRLCNLAKQDQGAVAILIEALARAPLSLLLDKRCYESSSSEPARGVTTENFDDLILASISNPSQKSGVVETCNAVFTNPRLLDGIAAFGGDIETFCSTLYAGLPI